MHDWIDLARATTASGDELVLRERAGRFELRCNGWELMSDRAHCSEAALAKLACERPCIAGPDPGGSPPPPASGPAPHILIGGLGFGYTLRAALDRLPCRARVVVVELLPEIIAWNQGVLAALAGRPLADPRVSVVCADVASLLLTAAPARFDAILLDTDNGPGAVMLQANARLYDSGGLRRIARTLRPHGVLAVWSADRSPQFEASLGAATLAWRAVDVPARGAPDDPLHTIYLAWQPA